MKTFFFLVGLLVYTPCYSQDSSNVILKFDSTKISLAKKDLLNNSSNPFSFFKEFSGGLNFYFLDQPIKNGMDMSVNTYHYYLVTGKRAKTDSILFKLTNNDEEKIKLLYKGLDFFLLNRASIDFQNIAYMLSSYITSLQASPLTLRLVKTRFLNMSKAIIQKELSPFHQLKTIIDARVIPYQSKNQEMLLGFSSHLYFMFENTFKRLEFNDNHQLIDHGKLTLKPAIGLAFGNSEMMRNILSNPRQKFLLSSECRVSFNSENDKSKNYTFTVRYNFFEIFGPKMSLGFTLSQL